MFTEGEPEFCPPEHKDSFLSMFMRIDRRFMGKCFGQMQELGLLRRMLEQITENIDKIPGTSGKMTQRK